jgi:hypothetical protein
MTELFELVDQYRKLHPNAENPLNYFNALGEAGLIEALKNANGEILVFIQPNVRNEIDGGDLA